VAGVDNDCRTWHRFDYGHVYASKSFYDAAKKRRVLWSWANESDPEPDYIARGWAGVQTVPRKIWLSSDGKQLLQWPIEEIETLRKARVGLLGSEVNAGGMNEIIGVAGAQADVEVVFEVPALEGAENLETNQLLDPQMLCGEKGASVPGGVGPFGLIVLASGDMQEHTSVFFRVFRHDGKYKVLMCTDLRRYNKNRAPQLILNLSICTNVQSTNNLVANEHGQIDYEGQRVQAAVRRVRGHRHREGEEHIAQDIGKLLVTYTRFRYFIFAPRKSNANNLCSCNTG
jgi:hypothetical protein